MPCIRWKTYPRDQGHIWFLKRDQDSSHTGHWILEMAFSKEWGEKRSGNYLCSPNGGNQTRGYLRSLEWATAETGTIFIVRWLQFFWVNTAAQLMPLVFTGSIIGLPGGPGLTAPGSTRKCFFPFNSPLPAPLYAGKEPRKRGRGAMVNNSWTVALYVSLSQRLPPRSGSSPPWRVNCQRSGLLRKR